MDTVLPCQPQVMVVCAHENMTLMAVGFKDGTVSTIRGNLTRDRLSAVKVVHSENTPGVYITGTPSLMTSDPTTPPAGLGFRQIKNTTILMVSTSNAVYAIDITHQTEVCTIPCCPLPLLSLPPPPLPPSLPPSLPPLCLSDYTRQHWM